MIKKFLIAGGSQIFLASSKQEVQDEQFEAFEILVPVEIYDNVKKQMDRLYFYISSHEDPIRIKEVVRHIYKILAPYAVNDKDRTILYERAKK